MGWSLGWDSTWKRDIGYGVPAWCDHPRCRTKIDRGLSYVCGDAPYGGDKGCGLFFCGKHLYYKAKGPGPFNITGPQLCARCAEGKEAFEPKPDHPAWLRFKIKDRSWKQWRNENPEEVRAIKRRLARASK